MAGVMSAGRHRALPVVETTVPTTPVCARMTPSTENTGYDLRRSQMDHTTMWLAHERTTRPASGPRRSARRAPAATPAAARCCAASATVAESTARRTAGGCGRAGPLLPQIGSGGGRAPVRPGGSRPSTRLPRSAAAPDGVRWSSSRSSSTDDGAEVAYAVRIGDGRCGSRPDGPTTPTSPSPRTAPRPRPSPGASCPPRRRSWPGDLRVGGDLDAGPRQRPGAGRAPRRLRVGPDRDGLVSAGA